MRICRASLGVVAVVRIATSVILTILLATGSPGCSRQDQNRMRAASGTTALSLGDVLIGRPPAAVLLGIYLIIPQFP
jgi:hypothetical protein